MKFCNKLIILLLSFAAIGCRPDYQDMLIKKMLFSIVNLPADSLVSINIHHIESNTYSFSSFDTIKTVKGVPVFVNDSQLLSESYQFQLYHRLIFAFEDTSLITNTFELYTDSAHYEVTFSGYEIKVRNTAPLHFRYRNPLAVLLASLAGLFAEFILLFLILAGMRLNARNAFHSIWMNLVGIPLILYLTIKFHYLDFPLGLVALIILMFLKTLFMYYASNTVRTYRRFLSMFLVTGGIAFAIAWFIYYLILLF